MPGEKSYSKSVLDFEQVSLFLSLREENEWNTLQDIYLQFKEDVTDRLNDIDTSLRGGDFPALALAAHSVKGCAGTFGMRLVEITVGEIEARARTGYPWSGYPSQIRQLHAAWEMSLIELEALFANQESAPVCIPFAPEHSAAA